MATTPMKAIREKCLDCCCGSSQEVKLCEIHDCALYPFRLGKNPNKQRTYTEEEKAALAARLKNTRDNRA